MTDASPILSNEEFDALLASGGDRPTALGHLRPSDQLRAQLKTVTTLLQELGPLPDQPALVRRLHDGTVAAVAIGDSLCAGRSPRCHIACPEDVGLSKRHFEITQEAGHYFLSDLHSTNGTLVNGQPCPSPERRHLLDGDLISAGSSLFAFLAGSHAPPVILAH